MGLSNSKADNEAAGKQLIGRLPAVGEATRKTKGGASALPPNAKLADQKDWAVIQEALATSLLFNKLEAVTQNSIVAEMYERDVLAGEILIKEGDTGLAASEMYVVKSGEFEVLERRQGVNMRVNLKQPGTTFGEVSLIYTTPRSATVAATLNSVVWVLERQTFRRHVKELQESKQQDIEVFLNSVPLLNSLSREEKQRLASAMDEQFFDEDKEVIRQGDEGDRFYIIKDGSARVLQTVSEGNKEVNLLFKADYFGEQALLNKVARNSTVVAINRLTCLTLDRHTFVEILGPLQDIMAREKSPSVVNQRLLKLQSKGNVTHIRAEVQIRRKKRSHREGSEGGWEIVKGRGHLDEVQALKSKSAPNASSVDQDVLVLTESTVLGGGAFSRVSIVTEESSGRQYALKRMRKSAVVACPEHVLCEQAITRNTAHPFCIRQYASFQDKYHLYFLFDLMSGGDLMDVLVAEAKVIKRRAPHGLFQQACFAPKVPHPCSVHIMHTQPASPANSLPEVNKEEPFKQKMLKGMDERLARFYIASLVLALEYLHDNGIVYRDLKPENVFIDQQGFVKLGDFGFAKVLDGKSGRTYTFCGTPGYVAPENVLAKGYNISVDWWGLGVLLYVLLTGRQPFSSPKTDDAMVVMRRIVDEGFVIKYPPYLSSNAKDLLTRLLERKPARRLGMLQGQANDVKNHPWFAGIDWDSLAARKLMAPRTPKDDAQKRLKDLQEQERRGKKDPKETPEELQECELVFAEF